MVNPARKTTVTNVIQRPGTGSPIANLGVTIRLNVLGFADGGSAETVATRTVQTDANGRWSVELAANADIDPAGTYYTVHEGKVATWSIVVPPAGSPVNLRDILVTDPANPSPMVAGVPLPGSGVPSGDVWITDGLGGGDYGSPSAAAGVTSFNTRTGVVSLTKADVTGTGLAAADVGAATASALTSEAATARAAEAANATAIATEATTRGNAITTEAAARAAADALLIPLAQKGAANGVATLGSDGLVPTAQIPALALTTAVTVASQAAMLALTATQVQPGDIAVRTDGAGTFILTAVDPSVLANWTRLNAPTDVVVSVNGQVGTVTLAASDVGAQPVDPDLTTIAALDATVAGALATDGAGWFRKTYAQLKTALGLVKADVGLGNVDNTSDVNKPVSTAQASADAAATAAAQATSLQKTANLSDLGTPATARTNLGLGTAAVANKVAAGSAGVLDATDASTTNSRTPTAHAATHASGGSDPVTLAESQVTNLTADLAALAPKTTATIDLVDRSDNTTETVPAGTTTNCSTAGVTKTAPALAGSVGTPPLRWAVKNLSAGSITVSYPDQAGAAQSLTVLTGETRTFRQKTTSGWGVESGAIAVSTLDARYAPASGIAESAVTNLTADLAAKAPLASPALTGTPTAPTQAANDNSTKLATTGYVDTASGLLIPKSLVTTKGDLIVATGSGVVARHGVGSNGQVLTADSTQTDGVKWAAAGGSSLLVAPLVGDYIGPPNPATTTTISMSNGVVFYTPIIVPIAMTADQIAVAITTAGASGSVIRLALYAADANNRPGTLLAQGTIVGTSTSTAIGLTFGAAQTIAAGVYWLAVCAQGAPATNPSIVFTSQNSPSFINIGTFGALLSQTTPGSNYQTSGQTSTLASNPTLAVGGGAFYPLAILHRSA